MALRAIRGFGNPRSHRKRVFVNEPDRQDANGHFHEPHSPENNRSEKPSAGRSETPGDHSHPRRPCPEARALIAQATMLSEPPATKPRRNWHLLRWAFLLIALSSGWGAWKAYDFQQAVKEAEELGWKFEYTDPVAIIREDWRAAFRKDTWSDARLWLLIQTGAISERDFDLIRRLKPKQLSIHATFPWRDLSQLRGLSNLTELWLGYCPNLTNIHALKDMKELPSLTIAGSPILLNIDALKELKNLTQLDISGCTALTNVDALRELKALKVLNLEHCTGLKNVDGLLGLRGLEEIYLDGCTGLAKEAVDAVKAALPKTKFNRLLPGLSPPPP